MANSDNGQQFIGTWDHFSDENFDTLLKEIGLGLIMRQVAKTVHPRLIITENNGNWTVRAETAVKTKTINFTPGVEFDDTTIDGRDVKAVVRFQNGKWIQTLVGKKGNEMHVTRFVDNDGLHEEIAHGSTKATRLFKRVN